MTNKDELKEYESTSNPEFDNQEFENTLNP